MIIVLGKKRVQFARPIVRNFLQAANDNATIIFIIVIARYFVLELGENHWQALLGI